jgi:transcriptional regulator with XRE-family HTH domain
MQMATTNQLKKIREFAGYTQAELGSIVHLSQQEISRIESEQFINGDWWAKLNSIAEALDLSIDRAFSPEYVMWLKKQHNYSVDVPHRSFLLEFMRLESEPFSREFLTDLLKKLIKIPENELPKELIPVAQQAREHLNK